MYVFNAVTVGPGDQLVRPERKTHADRESEDDQVDSGKGSECYTHAHRNKLTLGMGLIMFIYFIRLGIL